MAKKSNQQQEEIRRAIEIARAHGYVSVNDQEHELIKLLRYTTYHGRNLVMETAIAMRCAHPWRYAEDNVNTQSLHSSGNPRFLNNVDAITH